MMDFAQLRARNVERCETSFKHLLDDWSVLEWAGAMAGEAGEAANVAKKLRRGDHNITTMDLAEELADVVIYCDLLAARCGIDLHRAIVAKFNATSMRRNSSIMLEL